MSMDKNSDKEHRFLNLIDSHKNIVAKVCYLYSSGAAHFDDLYQEVLINLWQGMDSFRGDSKPSTWIYRTAINTCITFHRRNDRYSSRADKSGVVSLDDIICEPPDNSCPNTDIDEIKELYRLISRLGALEKAIVTLWLDEKSYDEIALITGLSRSNVAVKIHRIKEKLSQMAAES